MSIVSYCKYLSGLIIQNEIILWLKKIYSRPIIYLTMYFDNDKLNLTQERISKIIDMHVDGKIDSQTYHFKLEEYKREQQSLMLEIKSYNSDNKVELFAAKEVLKLVSEAKELFMSSNFDEKQQLLRFFFSNLTLDAQKLDVELREPFNLMQNIQDRHIWRD
jgi:hypothetical protein